MAEDLALDQGLGNRGAVDGDERLAPPRAQLVQGARHQLLARPALAGDQHRHRARRHALDHGEHLLHFLELPTSEPRKPVSLNLRRVTSSSRSVSRWRLALARTVFSRVGSIGFWMKS